MKSQRLRSLTNESIPGISMVYRWEKLSMDQTRAEPSSDTDMNRFGKFFMGVKCEQCLAWPL